MAASWETSHEVQYVVLLDGTEPCLLARVRWPDVFEAISAGLSEWQADPGLFDLPYDPASVAVTSAEAASIAQRWGAPMRSETSTQEVLVPIIRRMPANWSNLTAAEKNSWFLESPGAPAASGSPRARRRWRVWSADRPGRRNGLEVVGSIDPLRPNSTSERGTLGRADALSETLTLVTTDVPREDPPHSKTSA